MAWFGSMCRWGDGVGISFEAALRFHIPNSFFQLELFDTLLLHVFLIFLCGEVGQGEWCLELASCACCWGRSCEASI